MTWIVDHRRLSRVIVTLLVVTAVLVTARFSRGASAADRREIVLVVREMTFYADGRPDENPTLRFKAGETVRIVLQNQAPGMNHDFAIPAWGVATRALQGLGSDVVTFTVPARPGRYEYLCNPHSAMMRGSIEVE